MGKFIISEEERKLILQQHAKHKKIVKEQDEETKQNMNIQKFLNQKLNINLSVDGLMAPKTEEAITKYQQMIGVTPDGKWGYDTQSKMPEADKRALEDVSSGMLGKLINKFF